MDSSKSDNDLVITGSRPISVETLKQNMVAPEDDSDVSGATPRPIRGDIKKNLTPSNSENDSPESFSTDAVSAQDSDVPEMLSSNGQQSDDDSDYNPAPTKSKAAKQHASQEITSLSPKKGGPKGKASKTSNTGKRKRQLTLNLEQSHNRILLQKNEINSLKQAKVKQLERRKARKKIESSLREKNYELKQTVQELKGQISEHETTIQGYQDDAIQLLGKDKAEALPDEEVIRALTSLFKSTKEWISDWSIRTWNDALKAKILDSLILSQENERNLFATEWLVKAVEMAVDDKQTPVRMVLNALLNWFICNETFRRPFAHLGRNLQNGANNSFEDCMNWILEAAEEKSPEDHNKLRARICALLDKPALDGSKEAKLSSRQRDMQRRRQGRCEEIADLCLSTFSVGLEEINDHDEEKQRRGQMLEIVEAAVRLSARLSAENPKVEILFLNDMGKTKFNLKADWFKPHRALKLDDEEDDDGALDAEAAGLVGRPFDMVVEPCIARSGDAKGEEYDKHQVLHPAVVWMVKGMGVAAEESSEDEVGCTCQSFMQMKSTAGTRHDRGNGKSAPSNSYRGGGAQGKSNESARLTDRAAGYKLRRDTKPPERYGFAENDGSAVGIKEDEDANRNISASGISSGQSPSIRSRHSQKISDRSTVESKRDSQAINPSNDETDSTSEAEQDAKGFPATQTSTPKTNAGKNCAGRPKTLRKRATRRVRKASDREENGSDNDADTHVEEEMLAGGTTAVGATQYHKEKAPLGPGSESHSALSKKRKNLDNNTAKQIMEPDHIEGEPPSKRVKADVAIESSHSESASDGEKYASIVQPAAAECCESFSSGDRSDSEEQQETAVELAGELSNVSVKVACESIPSSEETPSRFVTEHQATVGVMEEQEPAAEAGCASNVASGHSGTTGQQDCGSGVQEGHWRCTGEISRREGTGQPEDASSNEQATTESNTSRDDSPHDREGADTIAVSRP